MNPSPTFFAGNERAERRSAPAALIGALVWLVAAGMACGPRCLAGDAGKGPVAAPLRENAAIDLHGRPATLTKLDTLPYVESDFTKRFRFDSASNPRLKELR